MAHGPTYGQAYYIDDNSVIQVNPKALYASSARSIAATALGTVRMLYGKLTLSATDIASGNAVGVRGEVNVTGTITGGASIYGAQGKFVAGSSFTMNHEDSRICGAIAQLDISNGTYTSGQLSALWVDMGASASASAVSTQGGGQCNIIRATNTTGMECNSIMYGYSKADFVFDLGAPSSTADWFTTSAGSAATKYIRLNIMGTAYKIALLADS